MLIVVCGLLWALESLIPLYCFRNSRVRHALTNVALTLILVITNLSLSFSSAYLAGFSVRNGIRVIPLPGSLVVDSDYLRGAGFRSVCLFRAHLRGLLKMPFMNYNRV